jgi:hypothetical protein
MSNVSAMMFGMDYDESTELFGRPSIVCYNMSEMVCALNETYF